MYVEKPFCKDLAEAAQIVSEADAAGVKLMVSQNARLLYGLPQLVELVRSGELGKITAGLMVKTSERDTRHLYWLHVLVGHHSTMDFSLTVPTLVLSVC